jgi:hypothetical protein
VNNIPGIEEVNMIKDDGTVIHFNNPKVQASLAANTFAVTGHAENKRKSGFESLSFSPVLRIRIQGLLDSDPDPLVRGIGSGSFITTQK